MQEEYAKICDLLSAKAVHPTQYYSILEGWEDAKWDFFGKAISIALAEMGVYQAVLFQDKILYEFGFRLLDIEKIKIKLNPWKNRAFREYVAHKRMPTGSFDSFGHSFVTTTSTHSLENSRLVLVLVLGKSTKVDEEKWGQIVALIENLGFALGGKRNQYEPLFTEISDRFLSKVEQELQESGTGVLTHFYIQDLEKYFGTMGLQKSIEILKAIHTELQTHLKKHDSFIHVSSRSIFTFSPRCSPQIILDRFAEVFIQVHHLIIDYRMRFREVTTESNLKEVWEDLVMDRN